MLCGHFFRVRWSTRLWPLELFSELTTRSAQTAGPKCSVCHLQTVRQCPGRLARNSSDNNLQFLFFVNLFLFFPTINQVVSKFSVESFIVRRRQAFPNFRLESTLSKLSFPLILSWWSVRWADSVRFWLEILIWNLFSSSFRITFEGV